MGGIRHRDIKKIVEDVTSCLDKFDDVDVIDEGILSVRNAMSQPTGYTELRYDDLDDEDKTNMQYRQYFDEEDGDVYDDECTMNCPVNCTCEMCVECDTITEQLVTHDVRHRLDKILHEAHDLDYARIHDALERFFADLKRRGKSLYDFIDASDAWSTTDINVLVDAVIDNIVHDIDIDSSDPAVHKMIVKMLDMRGYIIDI